MIDANALKEEMKEQPKQDKPGFFSRLAGSVREKVKDEFNFQKKLRTVRKESYRNERVNVAKETGVSKARKTFGSFNLSGDLKKADAPPKTKSNMEKMLGL